MHACNSRTWRRVVVVPCPPVFAQSWNHESLLSRKRSQLANEVRIKWIGGQSSHQAPPPPPSAWLLVCVTTPSLFPSPRDSLQRPHGGQTARKTTGVLINADGAGLFDGADDIQSHGAVDESEEPILEARSVVIALLPALLMRHLLPHTAHTRMHMHTHTHTHTHTTTTGNTARAGRAHALVAPHP